MNAHRDTLTLIQKSFSGQGELIERAFRENRPFRSLCEDYRECNEAVGRWRHRRSADALQRLREYEELLVELDREVQACLEALASREKRCGSPGKG